MLNMYDVDGRFHLVDLPGYGYARAAKTARRDFLRLLDSYLSHRETVVGIIWLLDVRREPTPDDRAMGDRLAATGVPVLAAITKADKFGRGRRLERAGAIQAALDLREDQCLVTSARTREGIDDLWEAIETLVGTADRRIGGR
jgi:GTP-binding protein